MPKIFRSCASPSCSWTASLVAVVGGGDIDFYRLGERMLMGRPTRAVTFLRVRRGVVRRNRLHGSPTATDSVCSRYSTSQDPRGAPDPAWSHRVTASDHPTPSRREVFPVGAIAYARRGGRGQDPLTVREVFTTSERKGQPMTKATEQWLGPMLRAVWA